MTDLANMNEIETLIEAGAQFYVGHSGGKDSQAMYSAIRRIVPAHQITVVHADLGDIEWPGAKQHIAGTIESPLIIAKARNAAGEDYDLFGMIRRRREMLDSKGKHDAPAFPSSAARFCTSDLKTGPIWREIRNDGKRPIVVNCVGIRGQESKSRQKKIDQRGTLNRNAKNCTQSRDAYDWWPIAHWHEQDVWTEIFEVAGQHPHPAYGARETMDGLYITTGNERLSCMFCIFGSQNDLAHAKRENPELYKRYIDLEIEVRGTMFNGESLAERIDN